MINQRSVQEQFCKLRVRTLYRRKSRNKFPLYYMGLSKEKCVIETERKSGKSYEAKNLRKQFVRKMTIPFSIIWHRHKYFRTQEMRIASVHSSNLSSHHPSLSLSLSFHLSLSLLSSLSLSPFISFPSFTLFSIFVPPHSFSTFQNTFSSAERTIFRKGRWRKEHRRREESK